MPLIAPQTTHTKEGTGLNADRPFGTEFRYRASFARTGFARFISTSGRYTPFDMKSNYLNDRLDPTQSMHSDRRRDGDFTLATSRILASANLSEILQGDPHFQRYIFLLLLCPSAVGGIAC